MVSRRRGAAGLVTSKTSRLPEVFPMQARLPLKSTAAAAPEVGVTLSDSGAQGKSRMERRRISPSVAVPGTMENSVRIWG